MYLSIFVFFTVVSFFYDIATLRCYTSIHDGFICFLLEMFQKLPFGRHQSSSGADVTIRRKVKQAQHNHTPNDLFREHIT